MRTGTAKALHIVQGGVSNGDKELLERLARTGKPTPRPTWVAPKAATIGDEVVIYIGGYGFFATGYVKMEAEPRGDWPNRYGVQIESVKLIDPPISLGAIRRRLPDLTWAIYPRSTTTPAREVADRVRALIANRRRIRMPEDVDSAALEEANIDELRKVALMGAKPNVSNRRRTVIERAASAAIRLYVLRRAAGYCEGCADVAPFRCVDGSGYLEAHHTTRLADGGPDHPGKVIALCPNCHRRAHHSADAKTFNVRLIKKLRRLEKNAK
jgi:hypothetical protein